MFKKSSISIIVLCVIIGALIATSIISPFKHNKDVVIKQYGKSAIIEKIDNLNNFEAYRVIDSNKESLVVVKNGNINVLRETEYECRK